MNRTEIQYKIELFRRELRVLESIQITCRTCGFGASGGWCEKHQAVPPAEVQATGCDDFLWDSIPF